MRLWSPWVNGSPLLARVVTVPSRVPALIVPTACSNVTWLRT